MAEQILSEHTEPENSAPEPQDAASDARSVVSLLAESESSDDAGQELVRSHSGQSDSGSLAPDERFDDQSEDPQPDVPPSGNPDVPPSGNPDVVIDVAPERPNLPKITENKDKTLYYGLSDPIVVILDCKLLLCFGA